MFITIVSWFRNSSVTYFPDNALGDARFDYFKQVVNIEPLDKLLAPYTNDMNDVGIALFTFLYVDFLDTSVSPIGLYTRTETALLEKSSSSFALSLTLAHFVLPFRERSWDWYQPWDTLMKKAISPTVVLRSQLMRWPPCLDPSLDFRPLRRTLRAARVWKQVHERV